MKIEEKFIKQVMECNWLKNCGKEGDFGFEVEYTKSQSKVKKLINGIKWENICLEERGNFTAFLHINHNEDYNKFWREMVRKIKSEYISVISESLEVALQDNKDKDSIIIDIKSNLVILFMLNFYSEYYKSDFYDKMLEIYLSGHLPCGWSGNYPEGKFIVY